MDLITEIASKVSALSPEQQREALALIEKLAAKKNEQQPTLRSMAPLRGATAREGKMPLTADDIKTARHEMWSGFYDEQDGE